LRYAVISDVHSNLEALEAVLREAQELEYDRLICLGDFVGYNADPSACLDILRDEVQYAVLGNHDAAAVDPRVADYFNPTAQEAVIWTSRRLAGHEKSYLEALPFVEKPESDILIVHGSPSEPEIWAYVISILEAHFEFGRFEERICLFGHSHLAVGFVKEKNGNVQVFDGDELVLEEGKRYMLNPGSVGQPRDSDPRAAFGILDTGRGIFDFRRVDYDVKAAGEKIRRLGLPSGLAKRLETGT
jgi:predicted phosphodiesterase